MRDYGQISPQFWIGETGKLLRGDPGAQVLAIYLMTSPHSTMTGVFHCPVLYMAHETGLGMEGASKALKRLLEVGFCEYDGASECIFVVRMAAYQIAESLKPGDNRVLGLKKEVAKMTVPLLRDRFLVVYGEAFGLVEKAQEKKPLTSPSEDPMKPRTGTGTGTRGEGLSPPFDPPPPEDPEKPKSGPSMAGAVCIALKSIGMSAVNPSNQNLIDLINRGADIGVFVDVGKECVASKKPFSYLLATVKGRMADAEAIAAKAVSKGQPQAGGIIPGAI
jgi:hypothetical protein